MRESTLGHEHIKTPIGEPTISATARMTSPSGLPGGVGAYARVDLSAVGSPHDSWTVPVQTYFRRPRRGGDSSASSGGRPTR